MHVVPAKPTGPAFGRPDDRLRASRDAFAVLYRLDEGAEAFRNINAGGVLAFARTTKKMAGCYPRCLSYALRWV